MMSSVKQTILAALLALSACSLAAPDKNDWLENAPELSPSASTDTTDEGLSNVGHAGHTGHR